MGVGKPPSPPHLQSSPDLATATELPQCDRVNADTYKVNLAGGIGSEVASEEINQSHDFGCRELGWCIHFQGLLEHISTSWGA